MMMMMKAGNPITVIQKVIMTLSSLSSSNYAPEHNNLTSYIDAVRVWFSCKWHGLKSWQIRSHLICHPTTGAPLFQPYHRHRRSLL